MKKCLALLMAVLMLCLLAFAGCGDTAEAVDSEYIQKKGTLVIGITEYAPMDYLKDGEWAGFDAEFATAFAESMNLKPQFVIIDWDNKFLELESKAIDCIWNGMTISEEVLNNTSCSNPYVMNKQVVVMKADKVAKYTDAASMKDLKFAAESGSAGESAANDNEFDVTAVTAQSDALTEVTSGSVDACIIDSTMAEAMTGEGTSYADLSIGIALTDEEYGVGFRKDSDMTKKLNDFIAAKKGTLLTELAEKYNLVLA